jgi:3-oxoacyl-[acyl-carrier-protein] synthase III
LIGCRITDARLAVPPSGISAADLAPQLGVSEAWILETIGVRWRWLSDKPSDPTKLGADAARSILATHPTPPDLLIYCCSVDRQAIPDGSVFVQQHLGLSGIAGFTVRATCLSFLAALSHASNAIATGQATRVLIVAAELASHSRNMNDPHSAALLGDGAAAVLLEATSENKMNFHWQMETWPEHADLSELPGGGLLFPPYDPNANDSRHLFRMDGHGLLRAALPKLRIFLPKFLESHGVKPGDIDWVVPHQTSLLGFRLLCGLGFPPERTINVLEGYGNCAAASMPMALAEGWQTGKIRPGQLLLFLGTAAGLSIGAGLLRC